MKKRFRHYYAMAIAPSSALLRTAGKRQNQKLLIINGEPKNRQAMKNDHNRLLKESKILEMQNPDEIAAEFDRISKELNNLHCPRVKIKLRISFRHGLSQEAKT